mmetsp:Transcript_21849/g.65445  ORF Transcript_21849/g.65445 Transcript_21849/m.65445 type:complete len:324 (+) Transcript_21849:423-1394(+)
MERQTGRDVERQKERPQLRRDHVDAAQRAQQHRAARLDSESDGIELARQDGAQLRLRQARPERVRHEQPRRVVDVGSVVAQRDLHHAQRRARSRGRGHAPALLSFIFGAAAAAAARERPYRAVDERRLAAVRRAADEDVAARPRRRVSRVLQQRADARARAARHELDVVEVEIVPQVRDRVARGVVEPTRHARPRHVARQQVRLVRGDDDAPPVAHERPEARPAPQAPFDVEEVHEEQDDALPVLDLSPNQRLERLGRQRGVFRARARARRVAARRLVAQAVAARADDDLGPLGLGSRPGQLPRRRRRLVVVVELVVVVVVEV